MPASAPVCGPASRTRSPTLLVKLAQEGKRVLRLKGGDPFVFGRGGEEAQALARAGVPFRIVPGITAGIGGLAYAGIPVTHRDTNHAVTFITGHGIDGKLTKLDWAAVSRERARPWCFYMGAQIRRRNLAGLLAGGRTLREPAAVVANAARADQQVIVTTLGGLAAGGGKRTRTVHHRDRRECEAGEASSTGWRDKALRRSGSFSITARRSSSLMENQSPISFSVRPQPEHRPLRGS